MPPELRSGKANPTGNGKHPSTPGNRYETGNVPAKVAGYLGLPDVNALKALLSHNAFQSFYEEYAADHGEGKKLKLAKFAGAFGKIMYAEGKNYGDDNVATEGWQRNDWQAHFFVKLSKLDFSSLEHVPQWGPGRGETTIEKWSRIQRLISFACWSQTNTQREKFGRDDYPNNAAESPPFMRPENRTPREIARPDTVAVPTYPPIQFFLHWDNVGSLMTRYAGQLDLYALICQDNQVKMPDPRRYSGSQFRDTIRRWLRMKLLGIDIAALRADLPNNISINCIGNFRAFQEYCRQQNFSSDTIRVALMTKPAPADEEIYENLLPPGVEDYYHVNDLGELARIPTVVDSGTRSAEEENERDVTGLGPNAVAPPITGAPITTQHRPPQRGQNPNDFYESDDDDEETNENEESAVANQQMMLEDMARDVAERANKLRFRAASPAELEQIKKSEEMARFFAEEPMTDEDIAAFQRSRAMQGAEKYVGPDYEETCKWLGFEPDTQEPQMHGSERVLKKEQVTALGWMIATQVGRLFKVRPERTVAMPNFRYMRPLLRGGILGDGMGSGKTISCLSFIRFIATNPVIRNIRGPTLVLAPSPLILYGWLEEVSEHWPGLRAYLYHGRNDGDIGRYYEADRILAEEIGKYDGTLESVARKWQFLFDDSKVLEEDTRKTIILATYASFSQRSKIETTNEDGEVIIDNRFRRVFGIVICDEGHALRNTASIRYKVCSALEADSRWLVTGTPMLNREFNLYGLIAFLWRPEWATSDRIPRDRVEHLLDLQNDIYDEEFIPLAPEAPFLLNPQRVKMVLQKLTDDGELDLVYLRKCLPQIFELVLLRRLEGSKIPCGDSVHVVSSSQEPLQISTVILTPSPSIAGELQAATLVYTNEFLSRLYKANSDSEAPTATSKKETGPKSVWNYPSRWLRRLRLLASDGLIAERLTNNLGMNGSTFYAEDIAEWRAGGVDYRWIANKARTAYDEPLEGQRDHLMFLSMLSDKVQYLCFCLNSFIVGSKEKCIIAYDLPQTGLILEKLLQGLRLRVAILHAQVPVGERVAIQDAFSDPDDHTIQILLVSMRIASVGIDRLQRDCCFMIIFELPINFNTVLQMIARVYRTGQKRMVRVLYLFMKDSIESYLWHKYTEKMNAEIVEWSTGDEAERDMLRMVQEVGLAEQGTFDQAALKEGCNRVVQRLFGAPEALGQDLVHRQYWALSSTLRQFQPR